MYLLCICVLQPLSFSWFNGVRLRECPKISWNWLAGWWRLVAAITAIAQEIYMFCNDFTTVICVTYIYYIHIYFHYGDIDVISTWVFRVPIWHPRKEWNLRELHFVYRFTYTISSFFHVEWVCACMCVYVLERARFFDYEIKCFPNGCEHNFFHFHVKNSSKQSTKAAKHFSIKCTPNFLSFSQRTLLSFLTPVYLGNLRFRRCCC